MALPSRQTTRPIQHMTGTDASEAYDVRLLERARRPGSCTTPSARRTARAKTPYDTGVLGRVLHAVYHGLTNVMRCRRHG
jgi:hypothetical protein